MQYKIGFSKIRKLLHKFLKTGRIQLDKEEFVPFMYWGLFGKYPLYIGYDFARFVMDDLRDQLRTISSETIKANPKIEDKNQLLAAKTVGLSLAGIVNRRFDNSEIVFSSYLTEKSFGYLLVILPTSKVDEHLNQLIGYKPPSKEWLLKMASIIFVATNCGRIIN